MTTKACFNWQRWEICLANGLSGTIALLSSLPFPKMIDAQVFETLHLESIPSHRVNFYKN
jgi:hypothetical protein